MRFFTSLSGYICRSRALCRLVAALRNWLAPVFSAEQQRHEMSETQKVLYGNTRYGRNFVHLKRPLHIGFET
jgi:hypothetical protein